MVENVTFVEAAVINVLILNVMSANIRIVDVFLRNPNSFSMFNYRQAGFAVDWCAFRLISPEAQVWIFS